VLDDEELNVTHQYALTAQKANHILCCTKSSVASRVSERILPLCSALVTPHPESCVQLWSPQHRKRHGDVGAGPEEAMKMINGLEPLSSEERLRELGLISLEKRRLQADLRAACQYLTEAHKKAAEGLLTRACSDTTRGDGFKQKRGRFIFDVRNSLR